MFLRYCAHVTGTDGQPENMTPQATAVTEASKHSNDMKQWFLAGNNPIMSLLNQTQPRHPDLFDLLEYTLHQITIKF